MLGLPPEPAGASVVAIGMATERSATTRRKDGLSLSRVDQHAAIGIATERSAATRLKRTHLLAGGSESRESEERQSRSLSEERPWKHTRQRRCLGEEKATTRGNDAR